MKYFRLLLLSFAFLFAQASWAQILNDSTQSIYGTKTTRIFHEGDYLRGNYTTSPIDTALNNMNRTRNWYADTTFHQDLGNIGTASQPILYRYPQRIGVRLGKNIFDRYVPDPSRIDYFDTKSPYSHLFYVQGAVGETIFEAKHARSYKNLATFGFTYSRIGANKNIGSIGRRDRLIVSQNVSFFTHIQSANNRYHLFSNIANFNHKEAETGGILVPDIRTPADSVLSIDNPAARLTTAANHEKRSSFHLTQFFNVAKEFLKVYHTSDYRRQWNKYYDTNLSNSNAIGFIYPSLARVDPTATNDKTMYKEWEHTVGITGNHPLFFYKFYAKRRDANIRFQVDSAHIERESLYRKFGQSFIGGETQFKLKDIFNVTATAEYQLFKDYLANVSVRVKFLTVSQSRSSYSPTLIQQFYRSNHYKWDSNFENIIADRTAAAINVKFFHNTLRGEVARINLQNYVIFNESKVPQQLGEQQSFYTALMHHHLNIKNFHWDNIVSYNKRTDAAYIRIPTWVANSKIYYQGFLFKKALFGQVGVEGYAADSYRADAFNPVTQTFFLQNNFLVKTYPVIDLFVTADIKSFNIFLKMANVNQGYPAEGYFTTPYYTALPRSFVFGLKWMFFD
ncbi:putative porin [Adhaeribacter aquaticus]|uniref:putative porin n=1 Tax=Adhaeribacter aquaticus TaxID=299567 RepID=UPI0003F9D51B|nr:putative porin [Adhaeribacter aquaticus]